MPCAVDVDGDGDLDLVLVGGYWIAEGQQIAVFLNDGNGVFTRTHTGGLADAVGRWSYQTWGDYDGDGDLDLFLGAYEGTNPCLFRNEGLGQFTPIPVDAAWTANGVAVRGSAPAWGDIDNNGWLDLAVGYCKDPAVSNLYGKSMLLRGLGGGQMEAMTNSPLSSVSEDVETFASVDIDDDGDLDLFGTTSGDKTQCELLFVNDGKGNLVRNTTHVLVLDPARRVGQAWGDIDNDQDLDLYVCGYSSSRQASRFFINQGGGNFELDVTSLAPTNQISYYRPQPTWLDYDNDGLLDFFLTDLYGPNRLYRNLGNGAWSRITGRPPVNEITFDSFNCAWGDYNGDGFLDLFVGSINFSPNFLYLNNGNGNHWLQVKLRGVCSNTDGLGALVRAQAQIRGETYWQTRRIASDTGRPELIAHFGLGDATNVTTLRIEWPSGIVQELPNVAADQFLTVVESQGYTNAPPGFAGAVKDASGLQLAITEPAAGARYILEASPDLVTWTKLLARTSVGGTSQFTDTRSADYPQRFYRLQVP
ncbi:MAG TPA: CRTAC1 family protein [Verrucomicrobiae bacterium]